MTEIISTIVDQVTRGQEFYTGYMTEIISTIVDNRISGGSGTSGYMVSHERIYQFIRKDKLHGGDLWKNTRHKLKHRKRPVTGKQGNIKN